MTRQRQKCEVRRRLSWRCHLSSRSSALPSSRRLARVLHRLLAEHGLLSFLSLLRAF